MIAVVLRLLLGIGSVGCGEHEFAGGDVERGSGGDWGDMTFYKINKT